MQREPHRTQERPQPQRWGAVSSSTCCAVLVMASWLLDMEAARGVGLKPSACVACTETLQSTETPLQGRGVCRQCFLKMNHRWDTISRFRYATFTDGTLVDLKHVRASMLLSQTGTLLTQSRRAGVVVANLGGWAVEWWQFSQGHLGGQPWGANEDLYSNLSGSLLGQWPRAGGESRDWAASATTALERCHGRLLMVRDAK